jgi:menaquinone-dependent protoporphyrinogen IX oxidase
MKNGIILYKSSYGSTKKYALWLQEKTGFALMETRKAGLSDVLPYDTVILGGGLYAGFIAGLGFLKKHYSKLQGKKVLVFAVGATPYDEAYIATCKDAQMKDELAALPLFFCRGAWDDSKTKPFHRFLINMGKKMMQKQKDPAMASMTEGLMGSAGQAADWTDESYLAPILAELEK